MQKFDAIVIGAGPSGSAAAYSMAKAGLSVLLLERGRQPGDKNASGAVFYSDILESLITGYRQEAPIERWITGHVITALSEDSDLSIKFHHTPDKLNAFSVLRSKFDRWLAQKAADAGALLITSALVEDLILKDGKVAGVIVARDQGEVYADIVIIAEGANSLLTEKAGLRKGTVPQYLSLGVKEVIRLPSAEIEKRFQINPDEGIACSFIGYCTRGVPGGGFLYTNRESLSLGLVVHLDDMKRAKIEPYTLLDRFKENSVVAPLIADGMVKEYSARLLPVGGLDMVPRLYTDGLMVSGDAAGFTMNYGIILRGMDFAIASGMAAAEAACSAHRQHDFSKNCLAAYEKALSKNFVLKDLKKYRGLNHLMRQERLFAEYPGWVSRAARQLFTAGPVPREKALKVLLREKPAKLNLVTSLLDMIRGIRDL